MAFFSNLEIDRLKYSRLPKAGTNAPTWCGVAAYGIKYGELFFDFPFDANPGSCVCGLTAMYGAGPYSGDMNMFMLPVLGHIPYVSKLFY